MAQQAKAASPPPRQRQPQGRLTDEQVAQLVGDYESGASMKVLASSWGIHRTTAARHLETAGVPLRRQGIPDELAPKAGNLYAEGWSCQRLGDRYDCAPDTVRLRLMKAGVRLRAPWERM